MAWMPTALLEPGFQLSFTAVAAIFVAVPRVRSRLDGYPLPAGVADALAVALACGLATAPIVLVHFGEAPVYTVVANVVAFVAAPLVLGLGLLAAIADPVSPTAAAGLASLAGWAAAWLELVARVVADLPSAQVGARTALVVAFAGSSVGLRCARSATCARSSAAPAAAPSRCGRIRRRCDRLGRSSSRAGVGAASGPARDVPRCRPGRLDPARDARARVLVDQGPPEADVAGQLMGMGVRALSALVLTHPQRDHVGGAADVIRRLRVALVLDPALETTGPEHEEALAAARARGVPVRIVRAGTSFEWDGLVLRVLWPADAGSSTEDPNLNAVVLTASFGTTDVFLPADAESVVTARLPVPAVEIMKVAHHGSEDPGLAGELRDLRPRIAVISCGRDNEYGHPRAETLTALEGSPGLTVYRTDEDGRVVIESSGRGLSVDAAR